MSQKFVWNYRNCALLCAAWISKKNTFHHGNSTGWLRWGGRLRNGFSSELSWYRIHILSSYPFVHDKGPFTIMHHDSWSEWFQEVLKMTPIYKYTHPSPGVGALFAQLRRVLFHALHKFLHDPLHLTRLSARFCLRNLGWLEKVKCTGIHWRRMDEFWPQLLLEIKRF